MTKDIWHEAPAAPLSCKSDIKVRIVRYASGICAVQVMFKSSALEKHLGGDIAGKRVGVRYCHASGKRLVAIALDGDTHEAGKGNRGGASISFGVLDGMVREPVPAASMRIVDVEPGQRIVLELPAALYGEESP